MVHQGEQRHWSQGKPKGPRELRVGVGRRIGSCKGKNAIGQAHDHSQLCHFTTKEIIFSTEYTSNQDESILKLSTGPLKRYKQTVVDKQGMYDDSFALTADEHQYHHIISSQNALLQ